MERRGLAIRKTLPLSLIFAGSGQSGGGDNDKSNKTGEQSSGSLHSRPKPVPPLGSKRRSSPKDLRDGQGVNTSSKRLRADGEIPSLGKQDGHLEKCSPREGSQPSGALGSKGKRDRPTECPLPVGSSKKSLKIPRTGTLEDATRRKDRATSAAQAAQASSAGPGGLQKDVLAAGRDANETSKDSSPAEEAQDVAVGDLVGFAQLRTGSVQSIGGAKPSRDTKGVAVCSTKSPAALPDPAGSVGADRRVSNKSWAAQAVSDRTPMSVGSADEKLESEKQGCSPRKYGKWGAGQTPPLPAVQADDCRNRSSSSPTRSSSKKLQTAASPTTFPHRKTKDISAVMQVTKRITMTSQGSGGQDGRVSGSSDVHPSRALGSIARRCDSHPDVPDELTAGAVVWAKVCSHRRLVSQSKPSKDFILSLLVALETESFSSSGH